MLLTINSSDAINSTLIGPTTPKMIEFPKLDNCCNSTRLKVHSHAFCFLSSKSAWDEILKIVGFANDDVFVIRRSVMSRNLWMGNVVVRFCVVTPT